MIISTASLTRNCLRCATIFVIMVSMAFACHAQPSTTEITSLTIGQQVLRIPTPTGFVETSRRSPELWATALSLSAGDARIVAHFVQSNDLAQYEKGNDVIFKNYLLVQTPKRAEGIVATQAQFDKLRAGTVAMQAQIASRLEPRLAAEVDQVSKSFSQNQKTKITINVGEIVPVSIDKDESRILIFTWLGSVSTTEKKITRNQTMVFSAAYCFVQGKVLMLNAYRHFVSPQDIEQTRAQISAWATAMLTAN